MGGGVQEIHWRQIKKLGEHTGIGGGSLGVDKKQKK